MTDERPPAPALPDRSEEPDEGTPSFHGAPGAGVPTRQEHQRVGGSGPGPKRDDTDEPGLGIAPYGPADAAGGGYGTRSGRSSGGTGDGEAGSPLRGSAMDDGTTSGATGATAEGPTSWLRDASGGSSTGVGPEDARSAYRADDGPDAGDVGDGTIPEDAPGIAGSPVGNDNIREGRVGGVMGTPHPSAGQGEG